MVSFVENSASIGSLVSKKLGLILQRRFILAPNVTQTEHLGAGPIWYSQSTSLLNTCDRKIKHLDHEMYLDITW